MAIRITDAFKPGYNRVPVDMVGKGAPPATAYKLGSSVLNQAQADILNHKSLAMNPSGWPVNMSGLIGNWWSPRFDGHTTEFHKKGILGAGDNWQDLCGNLGPLVIGGTGMAQDANIYDGVPGVTWLNGPSTPGSTVTKFTLSNAALATVQTIIMMCRYSAKVSGNYGAPDHMIDSPLLYLGYQRFGYKPASTILYTTGLILHTGSTPESRYDMSNTDMMVAAYGSSLFMSPPGTSAQNPYTYSYSRPPTQLMLNQANSLCASWTCSYVRAWDRVLSPAELAAEAALGWRGSV